MERFVCIHGHFYQPPRENPWLESIERQESAYPFHDWNERVHHECYAPNATARMLDGKGRIRDIVNNYSKISFNFGPTLLAWMAWADRESYEAILEADRLSIERFSGHGSAIAQTYNHMIMPLANTRDKRTQTIWGIRDFQKRFGRDPEGMWLPETAVDLETLDILAEQGIRWTILAPNQAARVRRKGDERWEDASHGNVDPKHAYEVALPSGRTIGVFFYDGPVSQAVAFENLLDRGENLASRIMGAFADDRDGTQLMHIATDGETYGHHHRHGEMALAYALDVIERDKNAALTNYGEFFENHPPAHEAQIHENSSWSCVHGVERWRADCGCSSGMNPRWRQTWRKPLRDSLDWLRDRLSPIYERFAGPLLEDCWAARDAYIGVILDRSDENLDRFLKEHASHDLTSGERTAALKLLEMQRQAMLMYTSCGWFFDDLAGIETTQVMRYAARAIQLAEQIAGEDLDAGFVERLSEGASNIPEQGDGGRIYDRHVRTSVVDLTKVCAHYAVDSLFTDYGDTSDVYCYRVHRLDDAIEEAGHTRLLMGRARVASKITLESQELTYGLLHFGDHNINGGVREYRGDDDYAGLVRDARLAFETADFAAVYDVFNKHFGGSTYTLGSLFSDEQQRVVEHVLQSRLEDIEHNYESIYERNAPIIRFISSIGATQPHGFRLAAEFVLNKRLHRMLTAEDLDHEGIRSQIKGVEEKSVSLDKEGLRFAFEERLDRTAKALGAGEIDADSLSRLEETVRFVDELPFTVDLWSLQKAWHKAMHQRRPEVAGRAENGDERAAAWIERFDALGRALSIVIDE